MATVLQMQKLEQRVFFSTSTSHLRPAEFISIILNSDFFCKTQASINTQGLYERRISEWDGDCPPVGPFKGLRGLNFYPFLKGTFRTCTNGGTANHICKVLKYTQSLGMLLKYVIVSQSNANCLQIYPLFAFLELN